MFFPPSKLRQRAKIQSNGVLDTSDHIKIKIKVPNPSQAPPGSFKATYEDLEDMDVLSTFKVKIESQILNHGYRNDQWPYPNQDEDTTPQSGTSAILKIPKWGLKGYGCSLNLQNQDRGPKFETWVYQRPVAMSNSRTRCQTPVRNLQHPPKPQIQS